ncbi:hypothetical protein KUCAC02_019969, partial [Chaenocephalus aceratus]
CVLIVSMSHLARAPQALRPEAYFLSLMKQSWGLCRPAPRAVQTAPGSQSDGGPPLHFYSSAPLSQQGALSLQQRSRFSQTKKQTSSKRIRYISRLASRRTSCLTVGCKKSSGSFWFTSQQQEDLQCVGCEGRGRKVFILGGGQSRGSEARPTEIQTHIHIPHFGLDNLTLSSSSTLRSCSNQDSNWFPSLSLRSEITSVRKELKESIGPLQAKVEQHGQTVLELERAATDHSGRITELEAT